MPERNGAEKRSRRRDRLVRFALWVLVPLTITGLITLRLFVLEAYRVPSGSMFPNIDSGDNLFVLKSAYGVLTATAPARGDVIAFLLPESPEDMPQKFIKRVVALPGDELVMDGGHPVINGWRVPSCSLGTVSSSSNIDAAPHSFELFVEFLDGAAYVVAIDAMRPSGRQGPYVVPDGEVYVLGDNRDNSSDSRAWRGGRGGGVPFSKIVGRAWLVYWPRPLALHGTPRLPALDPSPESALAACLAKQPPVERTRPPKRK